MKTINELRNELTNYKKTKKDLEELLEDKNLFNRRTIYYGKLEEWIMKFGKLKEY